MINSCNNQTSNKLIPSWFCWPWASKVLRRRCWSSWALNKSVARCVVIQNLTCPFSHLPLRFAGSGFILNKFVAGANRKGQVCNKRAWSVCGWRLPARPELGGVGHHGGQAGRQGGRCLPLRQVLAARTCWHYIAPAGSRAESLTSHKLFAMLINLLCNIKKSKVVQLIVLRNPDSHTDADVGILYIQCKIFFHMLIFYVFWKS